jgi:type II secretory pathway pseudopilin PulG
MRRQSGFSLIELAVVFTIVVLLIGSALVTLSGMQENKSQEETFKRLNAAAENVIAFAIVNHRLPCPTMPAAGFTGVEAFSAGSSSAGGTCNTYYNGYLPALTMGGFANVDAAGYALDAYGNRIRYAVTNQVDTTTCTGTGPYMAAAHFTTKNTLKTNGVGCKPATTELDVWTGFDACIAGALSTAMSCGTSARLAPTQTIAFIVFSTGKNGAVSPACGTDEQANLDNNNVFINHPPTGSDCATTAFDDFMVIVPASMVYARLVSAGVLP